MDRLKRLLQKHRGTLDRQGGLSIRFVYSGGPTEGVPMSATVARTEFEHVEQDGGAVQFQARVYYVSTESMKLVGETVYHPQAGDVVEEIVDGETWTHKVLGLAPYEYVDFARSIMAIRTVLESQV